MRAALFTVALVLVGSRGGAPPQAIEGTLLSSLPGETLTIANERTDPTGLVLLLRDTQYEGTETLRPGIRVKVWFRGVGERRPIASRVRALAE